MQYFFLLLLSFSFIAGKGQPQVYNLSLIDSTLPYLYIGVDNAIEIDWKGLKPETHQISVSGGGSSITALGNNKYLMRATTVTDQCFLTISNSKSKAVLKQAYKVRHFEFSPLSLGGIQSGATTTKEKILANPFLSFECGDCYYKPHIQIVSFVLTVDVNEHIEEAPGTGNQLTEKQIALVKKAGDLLTIDNIRAIGPDGRNARLPSLVYYIQKDELQQNP